MLLSRRSFAARGAYLTAVVSATIFSVGAPQPAQARELLVVGRDADLVKEVCAVLAERGAQPATDRYESRWAQQNAEYKAALAGIRGAQEAFRSGDIDRAWQKISESISTMEGCYGVIRDFDALAQAYLFRADLANARGDTTTAEDSYLVAARLGGDLELDATTTSPLVIEGYRTAHELLANSPTGSLTIVTDPPGSLVWIDGQRRGEAPLTVTLPAGPHLAKAQLPGYDAWAAQVPVLADDIKQVEIFMLKTSPMDLAAVAPTAQRLQALRAVDNERDWLVITRVDEAVNFSYLPLGGQFVTGGPVTLSGLPEALGPTPPDPIVDSQESDALGWPWILAGVGGGVGALGAIGAMALEGTLFFTDAGSGQERLDMQLAERVLLGLAGLGLVAGGVGAAVGLASSEETATTDEQDAPVELAAEQNADAPDDASVDEVLDTGQDGAE